MGKSGPLERAQLANQIQGFRIPDRSDAWENNKYLYVHLKFKVAEHSFCVLSCRCDSAWAQGLQKKPRHVDSAIILFANAPTICAILLHNWNQRIDSYLLNYY